jgi:hypothetical protein
MVWKKGYLHAAYLGNEKKIFRLKKICKNGHVHYMPVQRCTYIILTHDTIPPLESGPTTFYFFAFKKALRKVPLIRIFDNSIPK